MTSRENTHRESREGVGRGCGVGRGRGVALGVGTQVLHLVSHSELHWLGVGVGLPPGQVPLTLNTMCMFGKPMSAVRRRIV